MVKCSENGCGTRAFFGFESGKPLHCQKHLEDEKKEYNVLTVKCVECLKTTSPKDSKKAGYGIRGTKTPKFCSTHKPVGYVDVMSTLCCFKGKDGKLCETRASYGDKDEKKKKWCGAHRPGEYVDANSRDRR